MGCGYSHQSVINEIREIEHSTYYDNQYENYTQNLEIKNNLQNNLEIINKND